MKISVIIPVYYNEANLRPLYDDLRKNILDRYSDDSYELVMVDDGSGDGSYQVMCELASLDPRIRTIRLSRNFGSHAAILCGLENCTGDCAVVKAADMQESSGLIGEMVAKWKDGFNVVLACRTGRQDKKESSFFSNLYYAITRKAALPTMPKNGFDVYLIDRKVIEVLKNLEEKNSALTGQILWSGFRTGIVYYERQKREIGKSRWTLRKKVRLVADTLFSFSTFPITVVSTIGALSFFASMIWAACVFFLKVTGKITVEGWTLSFIFSLFSFGVTMLTLGILGGYLWRTFDAARNRPPYIIEDMDAGVGSTHHTHTLNG